LLEQLSFDALSTLTPSALLMVCIAFILTGRLIPVRTHERELAARDQQIVYLQSALNTCRETDERRTEQVSELMEHSRSTTAFFKSLSTDADQTEE